MKQVKKLILHHITNPVAMNLQAEVTELMQLIPIMAESSLDAHEVACHSDGLVLNLGMPTPDKIAAIRKTAPVYASRNKPIVLDPVGVHLSAMRCELVFELLESKAISILKGNSSEIEALLGNMTREQFAVKYSVTVVETGKISIVNNATHYFEIEMPVGRLHELPATGCALGTLMAGFMIKGADAYQSVVCALEMMSEIGRKMDITCPYGRLKETFLNEMEVCICESLLCDK